MFNYLFPIFCFGLLITGIVCMGIMEAAEQQKRADFVKELGLDDHDEASIPRPLRTGSQPRSTVRNGHD